MGLNIYTYPRSHIAEGCCMIGLMQELTFGAPRGKRRTDDNNSRRLDSLAANHTMNMESRGSCL